MTRVQEVHLRLSTTLPSHTHYRPAPADAYEHNRGGRPLHTGKGKPVLVNGRRFESMGRAADALGTTRQHIHYLVQIGKAKHVK